MNLRDRLNQMRREYRKDAARLDQRIDEAEARADKGLEKLRAHISGTSRNLDSKMLGLQERMQAIQERIQTLQEQMQLTTVAINDEFGAVVESIQQLRVDQKEVTRTISGRNRLLEDRFGKMIEVIEAELDTELTDLKRRVEALEKRIDPAA